MSYSCDVEFILKIKYDGIFNCYHTILKSEKQSHS